MMKRFTEDEFVKRIKYLWEQFHTRPEMCGISFEDFKKECYEEFRKQQKMSDKDLDKYRKNMYNSLIDDVNKLTTEQEKQNLNKQDNQTITIQDEMKFNNEVNVVNGNKNM